MDSRKIPIVEHADEDSAQCSFCFTSQRHEWFNRPVAHLDECAMAVPSLGCLVPGYLLVMPFTHVTSTCGLPEAVKPKFASFVIEVVAQLRSVYGMPVTMFEHGGCSSPYESRSACVNHAHLHLVPGNYGLKSEAPEKTTKHSSFGDFLESDGPDSPYLMLQDPCGPIVSFADQPTPQFFRRVVAARLGMPECWDYALYPFFDNIERTYKDFDVDMPQ